MGTGREGGGGTFDDILVMTGDSGKWQYMIFLFTWIEGVLIGFHHLSSSFLGYEPDHWCDLTEISFPPKWSADQIKSFAIPNDTDKSIRQCKMYDIKGPFNADYATALRSRPSGTVDCQSGYTYVTDYGNTIVSEWDLVCDRLALLSTVQGSYMGGVFVGCIFWGWASDKFGRRPSILIASALQIVSTIITAFSVNYIMFIFFRFLVAFSVSGVFECGFVLVAEIVGPKLRTAFGILTQFPFGIGASLLPAVAYLIPDWNHLQLAISVPCVLLASYYWFIPESPRWLVSKGRLQEALVIMKNGARVNRKLLPSDDEVMDLMEKIYADNKEETEAAVVVSKMDQVKEAFSELIQLLKTPEMRKRTLNMFYSWLVVAMVYYGLSFNTKHISTDIYIPLFISGFVEVVACVVIIPALAYFGRVKVYSGTFILGGASCLSVAIILFATDSLVALTVTLAMIGKFLIAGTFALAYLYTAELFPTAVRNVAVGAASTFARIGSMSAPYIVDLLGKVHPGIPAIIFGIFSTTAGVFALWLPETLNKKLPASVAEIEAAAKNKGGKNGVEMGRTISDMASDADKAEEQ